MPECSRKFTVLIGFEKLFVENSNPGKVKKEGLVSIEQVHLCEGEEYQQNTCLFIVSRQL